MNWRRKKKLHLTDDEIRAVELVLKGFFDQYDYICTDYSGKVESALAKIWKHNGHDDEIRDGDVPDLWANSEWDQFLRPAKNSSMSALVSRTRNGRVRTVTIIK